MVHGKEIDTRFYYCEVEGCDWRHSSSFDKVFNAKELPTSPLPDTGGPPLSKRKQG